MIRLPVRGAAPVWVLLFACMCGCQSTGVTVLNLIGITEKPLVIMSASERGLVDVPLQAIDPFAKSRARNDAMSKELGRPVVTDLCFTFQLEPNLTLGLCHLADVSALQYARMKNRAAFSVLAASIDEKDRIARSGLLVVNSKSAVQKIEELRGKVVAFGSARDARTHHAALQLLAEHGLEPKDLSLELFPVPGSLKMFAKSRDVAQSVLNGSSAAGFVDEQDWEQWPETSAAAGEPARDRLRILGKTAPIAERIILRSPKVDDATAAKVTDFLISAGQKHRDALSALGISGYRKPTDADLAGCDAVARVRSPSDATAEKRDE